MEIGFTCNEFVVTETDFHFVISKRILKFFTPFEMYLSSNDNKIVLLYCNIGM